MLGNGESVETGFICEWGEGEDSMVLMDIRPDKGGSKQTLSLISEIMSVSHLTVELQTEEQIHHCWLLTQIQFLLPLSHSAVSNLQDEVSHRKSNQGWGFIKQGGKWYSKGYSVWRLLWTLYKWVIKVSLLFHWILGRIVS